MGASKSGALPHDSAIALYIALTLILLVARILGEISKKLNQPVVMGELLAGIVLGKTCLGYISPDFFDYLFDPGNKNASALAGVTSICVSLYMLIAGLEMNLKNASKKRNASFSVGFFSLVIPFMLGFLFAYYFPAAFGAPQGASVLNYAMFTGTAMAITALPVVAKTLRDLHLFRTELGVVVISAAVFDDLLGWSLFAVTLAVASGDEGSNGLGLAGGIVVSILYVVIVLTAGAWITNRILPFIQAYLSFPAGELGFICLVTLASSAFALWVGLHNTLGAFVAGAAIGNSHHFRAEMRETLDTFVSFMLAPIFFGSVCISANFVTDFDAGVVFSVFFVSCLGKFIGGFLGAKITKSNTREALAIAVCMNSRGAMELILAQVALEAGIIDGRMFVSLVFMAIVTSIMPGPILRRIMRRPPVISVLSILSKEGFDPDLKEDSMQSIIRRLATSVCHAELAGIAVERELTKSGSNADNLAIPTVLSPNVKHPIAVLGIIRKGMQFDPNDKHLTKFVVLFIIPEHNPMIEMDLIREVTQIFSSRLFRDELMDVTSYVELVALFQIEKFRQGMAGHNNPNPDPVFVKKESGEASQTDNQAPEAELLMNNLNASSSGLDGSRVIRRELSSSVNVNESKNQDIGVV